MYYIFLTFTIKVFNLVFTNVLVVVGIVYARTVSILDGIQLTVL